MGFVIKSGARMTATPSGTRTIDDFAAEFLAKKTGVGMISPFYAETVSTKGDENWPLWIVRNKTCNSLGCFMSREFAEALAAAMNQAA